MKKPSETPEKKTPIQGEADQAAPVAPKRPLNISLSEQPQREPQAKPAEGEVPARDAKTIISALKESEARLRALVENSTDLIGVYYFDGRTADISRDYCGYSVEDWAHGGLTFLRSLHSPDSLKRLDKALEYVLMARERATDLRA